MAVVGPGRVVLLEEVPAIAAERRARRIQASLDAKAEPESELALRVTGTVEAVDCFSGLVTLQHRGAQLAVDVSLLHGVVVREHQLYQFIGELEEDRGALGGEDGGGGAPVLRARVARNVQTLDMELFEKALMARRKFLEEVQ